MAISINFNFAALTGSFYRSLQVLRDTSRVLGCSIDAVTDETIDGAEPFATFEPASNARLALPEAKERAKTWLHAGFVREAIEATGLFLDECLFVCELVRLGAAGQVQQVALQEALCSKPAKHHKLHFPKKISLLHDEFGIRSDLSESVLSINKLRTCLVHRLGRVGSPDVDAGNTLSVTWRTSQLIAIGNVSGTEVLLRRGVAATEESTVAMRIIEHTKTFALGEEILLSYDEIFATIFTLWSFGESLVQAVTDYAQRLGIPTRPDVASAAPAT